MNVRQVLSASMAVAASITLAACETPGPQPVGGYYGSSAYPSGSYGAAAYPSDYNRPPYPAGYHAGYYGTVESVQAVRESGGSSGVGAVIGGVAGGLLGHQIGSGSGNTAATIGGAVGGAVVGNEIEKRRSANETYRFRVRMDDGSIQDFTQDTPEIRAGSRVRVDNGRLALY